MIRVATVIAYSLTEAYLVIAGLVFAWLFTTKWLLGGMGRISSSLKIKAIISASVFWPKTWWLKHQKISLYMWERYREERRVNFTKKEAEELIGRYLRVVKGFSIGAGALIPGGVVGIVAEAPGSLLTGYCLVVMWTIVNPDTGRYWPNRVAKWEFGEDGRVALAK